MSAITHHTPDSLIAAYASGNLSQPYSLVVAAHISLCLECRASYEAHQTVGGTFLETSKTELVSEGLKAGVLDLLDEPFEAQKTYQRSGAYPGPVMEALKGKPPRWKRLGMGTRQSILSSGPDGSVRLLYIPPGQAVPDHSHNGLELTLVLQGSFHDETGRFEVGDIEIADQSLEHTPIAGMGAPCICLAATDTPLRFASLIPRLLQPILRI